MNHLLFGVSVAFLSALAVPELLGMVEGAYQAVFEQATRNIEEVVRNIK